jgi:hypothetical protein
VRAGEVVSELLSDPDSEAELLEHYSNFYKTGYDMYQRLIRAYYDHNYSLLPLMKSAGIDIRTGHVRDNESLIRLMSGDFWDAANTVNPILRAERSMDIFAPFERVLECPHYNGTAGAGGMLAKPLHVREAR